jgi:hypothetical protein
VEGDPGLIGAGDVQEDVVTLGQAARAQDPDRQRGNFLEIAA